MLEQVKAVLNFSAFRPEPDDPSAAWKSRFPKKTTALLHFGRNSLDYCLMGPEGAVSPGEQKQGDYKEVLKDLGPAIKSTTHDGWCVVSLDTRYVISIETNLSRKKGSEEALKKDPRSVLHARYEKGKRYAVTHNPETNTSLLLTVDEENIKKVEGACKEQQLKVGRMCCGAWVLLRHVLAATNKRRARKNPSAASTSSVATVRFARCSRRRTIGSNCAPDPTFLPGICSRSWSCCRLLPRESRPLQKSFWSAMNRWRGLRRRSRLSIPAILLTILANPDCSRNCS